MNDDKWETITQPQKQQNMLLHQRHSILRRPIAVRGSSNKQTIKSRYIIRPKVVVVYNNLDSGSSSSDEQLQQMLLLLSSEEENTISVEAEDDPIMKELEQLNRLACMDSNEYQQRLLKNQLPTISSSSGSGCNKLSSSKSTSGGGSFRYIITLQNHRFNII